MTITKFAIHATNQQNADETKLVISSLSFCYKPEHRKQNLA